MNLLVSYFRLYKFLKASDLSKIMGISNKELEKLCEDARKGNFRGDEIILCSAGKGKSYYPITRKKGACLATTFYFWTDENLRAYVDLDLMKHCPCRNV